MEKVENFFMLVVLVFLISGVVIGYLFGGYTAQEEWKEYVDAVQENNEEYKKENCVCINKTLENNYFGGIKNEWI